MIDERLINLSIKELDAQYEQATIQMRALEKSIEEIKQYASKLLKTKDFSSKPQRMSNIAWIDRVSEMIQELVRVQKGVYPTQNAVLKTIYIRLRDVYGVVLDQLRKDFKYKYDTLRSPSALEAISDNDRIRSIFESILTDLFPESYFEDKVLVMIEKGEDDNSVRNKHEDAVWKTLVPLATKRMDDSFGYSQTLDAVCREMDCSWGNLQTRYKKKHGTEKEPTKMEIITENPYVMRKFKKTVCEMLANC